MKFKLILLTLTVLLLVACGRAPAAEPIVVVSETATTRTIEHTFGTTEIPKEPQRVVLLGEEGLLANLLDVGIQPLMSLANVPDYLPLISDEEQANLDIYSSTGNVSIETILLYDPDLIIGSPLFIERAGYGRLSDIAPTVAVGGTSTESYIDTAALFGLRDQAEADVAAFEALIVSESERIQADQVTVSVAAVYSGVNVAIFIDGPNPQPEMLKKMGVRILPEGEDQEAARFRNGRAFIDEERLDLIAGEKLIMLQTDSVDGEMDAVAEMTRDPLWQQLTAVKNGQVATLDRLGYPGFRGQQQLLADLVAILE